LGKSYERLKVYIEAGKEFPYDVMLFGHPLSIEGIGKLFC